MSLRSRLSAFWLAEHFTTAQAAGFVVAAFATGVAIGAGAASLLRLR